MRIDICVVAVVFLKNGLIKKILKIKQMFGVMLVRNTSLK